MPIEATYEERALYTVAGTIEVAGDAFEPGQLLVLRPGDAITVAARSGARFMLFGGAPMDGPRYIWWNFVSSRPERIEAAKEEWARGRFDTVPGDEAEFIPLPDGRTTRSAPRAACITRKRASAGRHWGPPAGNPAASDRQSAAKATLVAYRPLRGSCTCSGSSLVS